MLVPETQCPGEETQHGGNHTPAWPYPHTNSIINCQPPHRLQNKDMSDKNSVPIPRLKMNWYSQGNRSGKLISSQYKWRLSQTKIFFKTDSKGNWLTNPLDIANCFRHIYAADNQPSDQTIRSFLSSIQLKALTPDQIAILSQPFKAHKINKLIGNLPLIKLLAPTGSITNTMKNSENS